MFDPEDGEVIQIAVKRIPENHAHVELGAWCGRSLSAACEALPKNTIAFSYDNYLEDSQATDGSSAPITPEVAKNLRWVVQKHYIGQGKDVRCFVKESSQAGLEYGGPPVSVLFVDDHHTAEQVKSNIAAWMPHCAEQCTVLFHDYYCGLYGIVAAATEVLPSLGFTFVCARGGIGIWSRGYLPVELT